MAVVLTCVCSPGFFRFYSHIGALHALEEQDVLSPSHLAGSSAGALVAGFLAAGLPPKDMVAPVLSIQRKDMWDMGGMGGLLKGQLFHELIESNLPNKRFEHCRIPVGITAYDVLGFRTKILKGEGELATAIRASCTFPLLFQPVSIDGYPHIDGGIFDDVGLMALPGLPSSNLIVNIVFDRSSLSTRKLPMHLQHAEVCMNEQINAIR